MGWCSVERMRREMPNDEWLRWYIFWARKRQAEQLAEARASNSE